MCKNLAAIRTNIWVSFNLIDRQIEARRKRLEDIWKKVLRNSTGFVEQVEAYRPYIELHKHHMIKLLAEREKLQSRWLALQ